MFTFELICMLLEGYFKIFTLSGFFFGFLKILKFLDFQRTPSLCRQFFSACSACVGNFLAQAHPAQANCQRRLSLRKFFPCFVRFFSACSACVDNFLAQAQPAQANFQRRLSLRRHFFSACSACVGLFLAHAQHAQAFFSAHSACVGAVDLFWRIRQLRQAPVMQTPPGAAQPFVVLTSPGAAPAPCGLDKSMCSRGFCSVDKSRCS